MILFRNPYSYQARGAQRKAPGDEQSTWHNWRLLWKKNRSYTRRVGWCTHGKTRAVGICAISLEEKCVRSCTGPKTMKKFCREMTAPVRIGWFLHSQLREPAVSQKSQTSRLKKGDLNWTKWVAERESLLALLFDTAADWEMVSEVTE